MKSIKKISVFMTFLFVPFLVAQAQDSVVYNFNDATWTDVTTAVPETGSFGSNTINGIKLENAILYQKEGKGLKRIVLDRKSKNSSVEFPEFSKATEVLIVAATGSDNKTFILEEKVDGKWQVVGDPIDISRQKTEISREISKKATQIRILNNTSSSLYLFKVTIQY